LTYKNIKFEVRLPSAPYPILGVPKEKGWCSLLREAARMKLFWPPDSVLKATAARDAFGTERDKVRVDLHPSGSEVDANAKSPAGLQVPT
jgi:hypothetical protein